MPFLDPIKEQLEPTELVRLQRRKLSRMLKVVLDGNAFYTRKLAGIRFRPGKDPLDSLPLTTRAELQIDQAEHPPYGSNLTFPPDRYVRMHQTSASSGAGPLRWLDTPKSWEWFQYCWRVLFRAAGIRPADRFAFPFSFGPFIGFWAAFESAVAEGHLALAMGSMSTQARLHMMLENAVTVLCCTPTYALRMAEVARSEGIDIARSPIRLLIVAGEPGGSIPSIRQAIERAWGARVLDHSGMTEIGPCGFECLESPGGMHLIETEFIPEIIDPATGEALPEGQVGELVLTNLGRLGSPLMRYRTGDQTRLLRERCACGRWFARLDGGILGRTDEMMLVRGNNVFPSAIEEIVRSIEGVAEFAIAIDRRKSLAELRIDVEPTSGANSERLARVVADEIRNRLMFRPVVVIVEPGSLPRFEMKARRVRFLDAESVE